MRTMEKYELCGVTLELPIAVKGVASKVKMMGYYPLTFQPDELCYYFFILQLYFFNFWIVFHLK